MDCAFGALYEFVHESDREIDGVHAKSLVCFASLRVYSNLFNLDVVRCLSCYVCALISFSSSGLVWLVCLQEKRVKNSIEHYQFQFMHISFAYYFFGIC